MTPASFRAARKSLGLSQAEFARALGYRSADNHTLRQQVCDMEAGRKPIQPQVYRLAEMFARVGIPEEWR